MKTLTMYGYSDDNIVFDGIDGADEFGAYGHEAYRAKFLVASLSQGVALGIHVIYHGYWCFAIGPEYGDWDKMPDWPIRRKWGGECEYSETVEIDVPDDATLTEAKS